MAPRLYNLSLTCNYTDVLAAEFLREYEDNPLALADVLFLLPNRRAAKSLREAFIRHKGMTPTLLPQMLPIGDVEEDELFLTGGEFGEQLLHLSPAVGTTERSLLLARLIARKPQDYGLEKMPLGQAVYLAQELSSLLDMVENERLDFTALKALVPEEYARHWQETLKFLTIITDWWPSILAERGLLNPAERRRQLLEARIKIWNERKPEKRIVAAGTTATFPVMKELLKTILALPNGEVILYGLDKNLDAESWEKIDETHPQFELKALLDYLQIDRLAVKDLRPAQNPGREILISELMRPAQTTDLWRSTAAERIDPQALDGLHLLDCRDVREEALAIALLMRETLETPEKTAALVTSDRNLARRVAGELGRWGIKVDDSAGVPLSLTPVGVYLRLVAEACAENLSKVSLLSLFKHPLAGGGMEYAELRQKLRRLEKKVWCGKEEDAELEAFAAGLCENLRELYDLYQNPQAGFKQLLAAHIRCAEKLAATKTQTGQQVLWRGEAGEAAAAFVADLYEQAEILETVDTAEYQGLFEALLAQQVVRPRYGTHPRLKILGPIEARLNHYDVTIIGEVNEGIWPLQAASDPWMSRPMKKDFGFPLPEKAVGVAALDFSGLLGAGEVYLTRAERVQGTPMVKSRWWMRLETVLRALDIKPRQLGAEIYKDTARELDKPEKFIKIDPPAPVPPVKARPRSLYASAVEMWLRDPYAIYAKYILELFPLDDIEEDLSMADYGTIIHKILEEFNNRHPSDWPENARQELLQLGEEYFTAHRIAAETKVFWWSNFEKTVDWIVMRESAYRQDIARVHNEVRGEFAWEAPAGTFKIKAVADRVDETKDGRINIIDYKTGRIRSAADVHNGTAPQLPIEGLIAAHGGFSGIAAAKVAQLIYWQLGKKVQVVDDKMSELLAQTEEQLKELVALFDLPKTPYHSRPNPKRLPEYSDYEHLARVLEWSVQSNEE